MPRRATQALDLVLDLVLVLVLVLAACVILFHFRQSACTGNTGRTRPRVSRAATRQAPPRPQHPSENPVAFLRNTAVNLLNLHYAVHALASGTGGVFFGVFLLRAGVSAPGVLVALTAILAGRFLLRPLILPLGIRCGLRPLVIAGALLMAAQYPLLARVQGVDGMLYALCIVSAIGDVFYWTCYHAYFAALGDDEHRGHQISVREAAAAIIGIVAPLLGGWALTTLGPATAFGIVAVVQLFSALPLLGTPKVAIAPRADGALRAALGGIALFAADGWLSAGLVMIWQIALFNTLSDSFTAYGGAMALEPQRRFCRQEPPAGVFSASWNWAGCAPVDGTTTVRRESFPRDRDDFHLDGHRDSSLYRRCKSGAKVLSNRKWFPACPNTHATQVSGVPGPVLPVATPPEGARCP